VEKYSCRTVILTNSVSLAIYVLGIGIMAQVNWWVMTAFVLYIVWLEIRLIKGGCVNCYYYGRLCAFGRGKIAAWLFKQGDPERFARRELTFWDLLPDLLLAVIPFITGLVLLILNFSWGMLIALVALFFLASSGNGLVRSKLACPNCHQRELGCPAERFFNKRK